MFYDCRSFHGDVSQWNVANGTRFRCMFVNTPVDPNNVAHWNIANDVLTEGVRVRPGEDIMYRMCVDTERMWADFI
jgi:hypothetical protein